MDGFYIHVNLPLWHQFFFLFFILNDFERSTDTNNWGFSGAKHLRFREAQKVGVSVSLHWNVHQHWSNNFWSFWMSFHPPRPNYLAWGKVLAGRGIRLAQPIYHWSLYRIGTQPIASARTSSRCLANLWRNCTCEAAMWDFGMQLFLIVEIWRVCGKFLPGYFHVHAAPHWSWSCCTIFQ